MGSFLRKYGFVSLACAIGLGLGARVVMRIIALVSGLPGSFSAGGSFEVILLGAMIGLPVALGFYAIRGRFRTTTPVVGALTGVGLFGILTLRPTDAARSALAGTPDPPVMTALLFGGLFLLFGLGLEWWWARARNKGH